VRQTEGLSHLTFAYDDISSDLFSRLSFTAAELIDVKEPFGSSPAPYLTTSPVSLNLHGIKPKASNFKLHASAVSIVLLLLVMPSRKRCQTCCH
jgi:hypothetical protein